MELIARRKKIASVKMTVLIFLLIVSVFVMDE